MRLFAMYFIDVLYLICRSDFDSEHIIGQLTSNLWVATICEQIWIVDITGLIKGLKITDIDAHKVSVIKYSSFSTKIMSFYTNMYKMFPSMLLLLSVLLQIDVERIERLLKRWLVERDDMSVMHSIYKFSKNV